MKKSLKWVLTISILLNILLLGFVFGKISNHMQPLPPRPEWKAEKLDHIPAAKREEFHKFMESNNSQRHERMKEARSLREEVIAILVEPEFDEALFREKSRQLDELFSNSKKDMLERTIELAKKLNQEERKILADNLRRPPNQRDVASNPTKKFNKPQKPE